MIVLGIDVGLASLGFAFIDWTPTRRRALSAGTVKTKPDLTMQSRLTLIWADLIEEPFDLMAIEEQGRAWIGKQEKGRTDFNAVKVRVAEGVARAVAIVRSKPVIEVTPAQLRSSIALPVTASKNQIAEMVRRLVPGLAEFDLDEHGSDAVGVALAGGHRFGTLARLGRVPA